MAHSNVIEATSPDALVINRQSLNHSLASYYQSKVKAGGTYDAYRATGNTMVDGLDGVRGYTQLSRDLTVEAGFTTNIESTVNGGDPRAGAGENFNAKALNYADNMNGRYSRGYVAYPGDYVSNPQAVDNMGAAPSLSDRYFTMTPGFVLDENSRIRITDFKDVGPANGFGPSAQLSIFMRGFQNQPYGSNTLPVP
jgi:hypothetical protein